MFWVRWRQPPSLCRSCVSVWMLLFLRFLGFCKTLLTNMRVGHTGRDTAHVSKRAHCQLSLAILHARCCCFRCNGTLVAPPLCKLANGGEGAKLRASAAAAQQLSHLEATSYNWPTMMLSKSYRASIMPRLIKLGHLCVLANPRQGLTRDSSCSLLLVREISRCVFSLLVSSCWEFMCWAALRGGIMQV